MWQEVSFYLSLVPQECSPAQTHTSAFYSAVTSPGHTGAWT
jgi:hypothetical protein